MAETLKSICNFIYQSDKTLGKRLFWLADEFVKEREQVESLKAEVVKGLGVEGVIAKDLVQLHSDLTPAEGVPIRWKSQAVEPEVKFKAAQAVTIASLPELHAGTQSIGTVKVTALEGEPAIKVGNEPAVKVSSLPELHAGTQSIGTVKVTALEGEPAIKVGNEPAVKVSSLPELLGEGASSAELVSAIDDSGESTQASIEAAGEGSQAGLYVIAGLLAGLFIAACLWKVVDRAS